MSAIHLPWVAAGLAAVVGLGAGVDADRHRVLDRVTPKASTHLTFSVADRAELIATARRFTQLFAAAAPAPPPASLPAVVTPQLARQLDALRPTPTSGMAGGTKRTVIRSVVVQPGPPITALVLATLTVVAPGARPQSVSEAWTLRFTDTAAGWRVAGVQS